MNLKDELRAIIRGEVEDDRDTLKEHSRDTSLFEVEPEVVVFPKDADDIKKVVQFVSLHKKDNPPLSITGRSAGTDMTGGPLNESIILNVTRHINRVEINEGALEANVEPGVYYRDFEKGMLPEHLTMPTYPGSKTIAALGGMIMNNCGGERTLRYGQMREFVKDITLVLSDGEEHTFGPLTESELNEKLNEEGFEGNIYRKMWKLIQENAEEIKRNTPRTSKNSSGYALWRVWDEEKRIFNLAHLFVGSQGTLGMLTRARVRLEKEKLHKKMIVVFFKTWDDMPKMVNSVLPFDPESLEAFDQATLMLGVRFMPEIAKKAGTTFFRFARKFLPEALIGIRMHEIPDLIVIIELAEDDENILQQKTKDITALLEHGDYFYRVLHDEGEEDKYWTMRRESFNLLREHTSGKRTVPFVEDFCIDPSRVPEFLPRVKKLLEDNGIKVNIAGHAGNGNFHIIPLMDLTKESERQKILSVADEYYKLVQEFGGSKRRT
jgi:FAD/FMN-containing dehydrogenase